MSNRKMTITEALAEVKLIEKKITKKQANISANLTRYKHVPDPYAADGGSAEAMKRELQAIADLDNETVRIRGAIAQSNLSEKLTLGETTRTIYEWITWKREIADKRNAFFNQTAQAVKQMIDKEARQPSAFKDPDQKAFFAELVVNVDFATMQKKYETESELLDVLDGKLSLKNATTVIEF